MEGASSETGVKEVALEECMRRSAQKFEVVFEV
jgi:hypothetical protein